jgi:hypothetical protein
MKLPRKILLALAVGLAVAVPLAWFLHGRMKPVRSGPGIALQFEPVQANADLGQIRTVLEKRFDGTGAVVEQIASQFSIWIPYPEDRQRARIDFVEALRDFRKSEASPARIDFLLQLDPQRRNEEMKLLAPAGAVLHDPLQKLVQAHEALLDARRSAATRPADSPAARQALTDALESIRKARLDFFTQALTGDSLENLLSAAEDPANSLAIKKCAELPALYPSQATEIRKVTAARKTWRQLGGGEFEPEMIDRLALARGTIDFRIACTPADIDPLLLGEAADELWKRGPGKSVAVTSVTSAATATTAAANATAIWCEVAGGFGSLPADPNLLYGIFEGRPYLLCRDDRDATLTHKDPSRDPWTLTAGLPLAAPDIELPFTLDARGAAYMGKLSADSISRPLAMLSDDKVLAAPTLRGRITDTGVISWGRSTLTRPNIQILKEARTLQRIINSGVLSSPLRHAKN